MKRMTTGFCVGVMVLFAICCQSKPAEQEASEEVPKTPVTVESVTFGPLNDSIELNATSSFLQNNYVKATTTGYIREVNAISGQYVHSGKVLFTIETKESTVIGQSIATLDTTFKFSGVGSIKATDNGYITQLNHQKGDYVQDGEQLAVISDMNSFVFLLNLPYELRPFVLHQKNVKLFLPDGTDLIGTIGAVMPTVDSATQTQTVVIKVNSSSPIPQNLIAKVRISKSMQNNAQTLPRSAVLSDETQTNFWVMKMIDSATAVKTIIKKGIELKDRVQILDPIFSKDDQILVSGNYGMPDTASVIIDKP